MNMNLGKLGEIVRTREAWHAVVHGVTKSWTQPGDWMTTTVYLYILRYALKMLSPWFIICSYSISIEKWNFLKLKYLDPDCLLHHTHYTIVQLDEHVLCLVTQLCLTLCNPMVCSLPGSSVHGMFQARILEWVAMPFSRGSPQPRDQTQDSHIADELSTVWATRGA